MKELVNKPLGNAVLKYTLLLSTFLNLLIQSANAQIDLQQIPFNTGSCGSAILDIMYSGAIDSCAGETIPLDIPIFGSLLNNA